MGHHILDHFFEKAPNRTHRDPTPRRKENAQLSVKDYEVEIY
jgi:hypothetical protein